MLFLAHYAAAEEEAPTLAIDSMNGVQHNDCKNERSAAIGNIIS